MSQQILNGASAAFAFIATIFLMIGCIGHSYEESVVKNVSWIYSNTDGTEVWFGLQKAFGSTPGGDFAFNYNSDSCGSAGFCDRCEMDGKSTISLYVISTIFAAVSCGLAGALAGSHSGPLQLANVFIAFVSALFALIGFGLFMGDCYTKIDRENDNLDLEFGPGSILGLLGMLMMWVVVVMQFGSIIVGTSSSATHQPAAISVPSKI